MAATELEKLKNRSGQTAPLPVARLVLPALPRKILDIVPEMENWEQQAAQNIDEFVRNLNTVVNP